MITSTLTIQVYFDLNTIVFLFKPTTKNFQLIMSQSRKSRHLMAVNLSQSVSFLI